MLFSVLYFPILFASHFHRGGSHGESDCHSLIHSAHAIEMAWNNLWCVLMHKGKGKVVPLLQLSTMP
jgi:hypothetical protein